MRLLKVTIIILTTLNSCCLFIKEDSLGNNLYLSEYDNDDRRIIYSEESCSGSGVEIIPMTVLEYDYDSKWIIAKSGAEGHESENEYWIIRNDFDSEPNSGIIKSNTLGPMNFESFSKELTNRQIKLKLKRIK